METFCGNYDRKYRSTFTANNYCHPPHYAIRQNDYTMSTTNPSRLSYGRKADSLWNEHCTEQRQKRNQICSIALTTAIFVVAIAVLVIAALAFYMGALTTDTTNPLIAFTCSMKIIRGDFYTTSLKYNYTSAFKDKSRRYKYILDTIYQKSLLGPAFVSCVIERFKNVSLTIYFRLSFSRKKIPRTIQNAENTIKEILIKEIQSRKSIFKNVKVDLRSIAVKRYFENDYSANLYQRNENHSKPKDTTNTIFKPNVIRKPSNVTNIPKKKPTVFEEIEINEENIPVVQGSFTITKTDADITEKKVPNKAIIVQTTRKHIERFTTKPNPITTTKPPSTTTTIETTPVLETSKPKLHSTFSQSNDPWKPIRNTSPIPPTDNLDLSTNTLPTATTLNPLRLPVQPIYQSFTNPGLSSNIRQTPILATIDVLKHPIPVNKFIEITELPDRTTVENLLKIDRIDDLDLDSVTELVDESYVEIETVKYVPGSVIEEEIKQNSKWELVNSTNTTLKPRPLLNTVNKIHNSTLQAILITDKVNKTIPQLQNISTLFGTNLEETKKTEPISGHGLVEVIDSSIQELLMKSESTTKLPLVTLIPVKSNSGLRNQLRPRPKLPEETRGFNLQKELTFVSDNSDLETTTFFSETYTSINSELNYIKMNKSEILKLFNATNPGLAKSLKNDTMIVNVIASTRNSTFNNRLKKLADISNIFENNLTRFDEPVISTKAISSSYATNPAGLKILTKTFNKIPVTDGNDDPKFSNIQMSVFNENTTVECNQFNVKCGDGTCLPPTTRCNQLMNCADGADEKNCTCADYLRAQFLIRKICDGVVDCWDFSDENHCDWCQPGQYICHHSRTCIEKDKICDGVQDCPQGDDEKHCVTVSADPETVKDFPYYSNGLLMVRKFGVWGKLCTENFERVVINSHASWQITDLGRAVCRAITYQDLDNIERIRDPNENVTDYFELAYTHENKTKSNLSFEKCDCNSREVVKVKCKSLECGTRPQTLNHWASISPRRTRIVGGTNANLGSWPWQAALYKEGAFQCGATLISDLWLISAGHCFYHTQGDYWVARLGALRRGTTFPSPYEQLRPISKIILHPKYVDVGFVNDISLLRMESPAVFSDYIRPICLPNANSILKNGRLCTVIGWGQLFEAGRVFPDTLQEVQLPVISTAECRKKTIFLPLYQVTDDMFCAGYERGGRDACLGDSGGPLMCQENGNNWSLYGVTSNGYGCARANRPGVYTKVTNFIDWIETQLKNTTNPGTINKPCKGHRCPLGQCLPKTRLCNGHIECNGGSDEKGCF